MTSDREIVTKVAGIGQRNPDGSARQTIAAKARPGDTLTLRREPRNPFDLNAIQVWHRAGQVGFLNADLAAELAPDMDAGAEFTAEVEEVTGGTRDKPHLGLNIVIIRRNRP